MERETNFSNTTFRLHLFQEGHQISILAFLPHALRQIVNEIEVDIFNVQPAKLFLKKSLDPSRFFRHPYGHLISQENLFTIAIFESFS